MAKNRNQNRRPEHQDQQRGPAAEEQEQGAGRPAEERIMPSTTQVPRRQQKRFGHN